MIGIVIIAHGRLAHEYLAALEHVLGPQPRICAIAISGEDNHQDKEEEICKTIAEIDNGQGVVVATDLYGSSPANWTFCACNSRQHEIIYGVNLPVLIQLVSKRSHTPAQAAEMAVQRGRDFMRHESGKA